MLVVPVFVTVDAPSTANDWAVPRIVALAEPVESKIPHTTINCKNRGLMFSNLFSLGYFRLFQHSS